MVKRCDIRIGMLGQSFGSWSVLGLASRPKYLTCRCRCQTIKEVRADKLRNGYSSSCGGYGCTRRNFGRSGGVPAHVNRYYVPARAT